MYWISILNSRKFCVLEIDIELKEYMCNGYRYCSVGRYEYWISILNCRKLCVIDIDILM